MRGGLHATFDKVTRRRIFVGDVHGCYKELIELMNVVEFDRKQDQVVSVGDLFRKGPQSELVMEWARANDMLCVRGNHEERLIRQRKKFLKGTFDPVGNPDVTLMSSLSEEDFEWLSNLPYTIDFPLDKIMVVHAGLFSAKSLASHTPFELTEMRGVTLDGEAEKICADPTRQWAKLFDGNIDGVGARHVVFGHDAARGLQLEPFASGLDTGCVYGKHLTCLVVEGNERKIVKVRSFEQYCVPEHK